MLPLERGSGSCRTTKRRSWHSCGLCPGQQSFSPALSPSSGSCRSWMRLRRPARTIGGAFPPPPSTWLSRRRLPGGHLPKSRALIAKAAFTMPPRPQPPLPPLSCLSMTPSSSPMTTVDILSGSCGTTSAFLEPPSGYFGGASSRKRIARSQRCQLAHGAACIPGSSSSLNTVA